MATQKQKRERLIQKRQDELAATIASGLRAQEKDRQQRALRAQAIEDRKAREDKKRKNLDALKSVSESQVAVPAAHIS